MRFDDEMTERERWADDHGYVRIDCRIHGESWSDGGVCEYCMEAEAARPQLEDEDQEDE